MVTQPFTLILGMALWYAGLVSYYEVLYLDLSSS